MPNQDKFHWARKVSRRDIQRLYESESRGLLDEDQLDEVMYKVHARIRDMFEVRVAQQTGQVRCRSCDRVIPQPYWMGGRNKGNILKCDHCSWETTCGEFYKSYTGKDLLPGSRTDLFQDFLDRFPAARTPQEKMLLLDWLIHAFHSHAGVSGRLVAMNVIQGSRQQLIELLTTLASSEAGLATKQSWLGEQNNPIRQFRRKYGSHQKVLAVAAELGIQGRTRMPENELIVEILRLAPELAQMDQEA